MRSVDKNKPFIEMSPLEVRAAFDDINKPIIEGILVAAERGDNLIQLAVLAIHTKSCSASVSHVAEFGDEEGLSFLEDYSTDLRPHLPSDGRLEIRHYEISPLDETVRLLEAYEPESERSRPKSKFELRLRDIGGGADRDRKTVEDVLANPELCDLVVLTLEHSDGRKTVVCQEAEYGDGEGTQSMRDLGRGYHRGRLLTKGDRLKVRTYRFDPFGKKFWMVDETPVN